MQEKGRHEKKNRSEQNIKRNETFSNAFLLGFRAHETFLQNCKNYTTKTTTAKKTVAAVAGAAAATDKRREYNTIAILYSFFSWFCFFFSFSLFRCSPVFDDNIIHCSLPQPLFGCTKIYPSSHFGCSFVLRWHNKLPL